MTDFITTKTSWFSTRQANIVEPVVVLPSDIFFMTSADLPSDTKKKQLSKDVLENMAYTALETSSPFSPDDLFWGYFINKNNTAIHIFSALKSRVRAIEPLIDDCTYIFPSFIVALLLPKLTSMVVKYEQEQFVVVKDDSGALTISAHTTDSDLPVIEIQSILANPALGVQFAFTEKDSNSDTAKEKLITLKHLSNPILYSINLQDKQLKQALLLKKQRTCICLATTIISILLIITFVISLLNLKKGRFQEKRLAKTITSKNEYVNKIKQKAERTEELGTFINRKQAYFRFLEQINQIRPNGIKFLSLYGFSGLNFNIKCNAQSLDVIEAFRKKLETVPNIDTIKIDGKQMKDNQTIDFTISLTFNAL